MSMMTLPPFFNTLVSLISRIRLFGPAQETGGNDRLIVTDSRTSLSYTIPIIRNAVRAVDFRHISALGINAGPLERYQAGLRVLDPGYQNTAVVESSICRV